MTCEEPPLGACCNADLECIGDLNVFECSNQGGGWFEGETCDNFECVLFEQVCAAETGNMKECDVSNYGALGDYDNGGLSYDWNETGTVNYGGTFALGNSAGTMLLKYGDGIDNNPFMPAGFLNCLDTYHPYAAYDSEPDEGELYGGEGLRVDYKGCGFLPELEEDIFVHEFVITNNTGADVNGLYAAVYFDWDIAGVDTVIFDAANNLVIQQPLPPAEGTTYGITVLSDPFTTIFAGSQEIFSYPQSGWHGDSLYKYMSIGGESYPFNFADMGSMVSMGPFNLTAAGATQSKTVGFAIIGGANATDVSNRAALATTLFPCPTSGSDCRYVPGDSDENDVARELTDVVRMIAYYRGNDQPGYVCFCTEDLPEYKPSADADGNCVSFELTDVVHSIAAYRGPVELHGCVDCPGSRLGAPGEGTLVVPSLKSKAKINQRSGD